MATKKTIGLAEQLKKQAEERFAIKNDNEKQTEQNIEIEKKEKIKEGRPKAVVPKKQKTVYLSDEILEILRQFAFDKKCDQSLVVGEALEGYFKKEGYLQ